MDSSGTRHKQISRSRNLAGGFSRSVENQGDSDPERGFSRERDCGASGIGHTRSPDHRIVFSTTAPLDEESTSAVYPHSLSFDQMAGASAVEHCG